MGRRRHRSLPNAARGISIGAASYRSIASIPNRPRTRPSLPDTPPPMPIHHHATSVAAATTTDSGRRRDPISSTTPRTSRRPRARRHGQGLLSTISNATRRHLHSHLRAAARPYDRFAEATERENSGSSVRLKFALAGGRRPQSSKISILRAPRGNRTAPVIRQARRWRLDSAASKNLLITVPTGFGKAGSACAHRHKACATIAHSLPVAPTGFQAVLSAGVARLRRALRTAPQDAVECSICSSSTLVLAPLTGEHVAISSKLVDDRHHRDRPSAPPCPIEGNWHESSPSDAFHSLCLFVERVGVSYTSPKPIDRSSVSSICQGACRELVPTKVPGKIIKTVFEL